MGLVIGMAVKFSASVTKGLKLKVRIFWWLIPTFVEISRENLVGKGGGGFLAPQIMNRVKVL